jgi:hypothetical protein
LGVAVSSARIMVRRRSSAIAFVRLSRVPGLRFGPMSQLRLRSPASRQRPYHRPTFS